ncbi:two-component sensor histidine kinase [Lewinella aquimaris]|uniref:histidine kinase n=1 Tax=Neolewinella aquimaris TaxID=1835722 RepID=A0A840E3Y3_9BACT|nr:histidine kinase dimerization/phosphoacceptor domain -containing protein [Neolewinella aquimaris]MBB4080304.1 two-component sensor histidine kinase [Neolewinella aquimaris]
MLLACVFWLATPYARAQSELIATAAVGSFATLPVGEALVWLEENHVENPKGFHEKALLTLDRAYRTGDAQLTAEAHRVLMRWHAYHVPFTIDSIYHHGEIAIRLFKQVDDQERLAATSGQLAFEYVDANQQERAEALVFDAIKIYEDLENRQGLGNAYEQLSSIFLAQGEPELSIKYGLQALDISGEAQDYQNVSETWLVLLLAYTEAEQWQKAIHAGDKCIETIDLHGLDDDFNLARAYGYRGDAHAMLENYAQSLEDNVNSYAIVEAKIGAARPAAKTYRSGIGRAHYLMENYAEAIPHYEAAIEGYVEMGQGSQLKMEKIYNEVADCYFQVGNYHQAYLSQGRAYGVFDTMMQNKVTNLQSEALVKYESGKKDQAIEEQATLIAQKDRIQLLGIGLISLLLLFLGSLFYTLQRNKRTSTALRAKNAENELLLKEIHHRVKNNLQTVSSLLSLQSESISDKQALDAVQESKNRVLSMALLHQKLYQGESLAAVEMRDYFETIGKAIIASFGERAKDISLRVEMNDVELDIDTAVPVGLITNELVTNSIKHAFARNQKGEIVITLGQETDGLLTLNVADNGTFAPSDYPSKQGGGFGTLLVRLLTTQLGGKLERETVGGTSTVIRFPLQVKSAA